MGNFVGKAMEESMQRNQQFMTEINRFGCRPQQIEDSSLLDSHQFITT